MHHGEGRGQGGATAEFRFFLFFSVFFVGVFFRGGKKKNNLVSGPQGRPGHVVNWVYFCPLGPPPPVFGVGLCPGKFYPRNDFGGGGGGRGGVLCLDDQFRFQRSWGGGQCGSTPPAPIGKFALFFLQRGGGGGACLASQGGGKFSGGRRGGGGPAGGGWGGVGGTQRGHFFLVCDVCQIFVWTGGDPGPGGPSSGQGGPGQGGQGGVVGRPQKAKFNHGGRVVRCFFFPGAVGVPSGFEVGRVFGFGRGEIAGFLFPRNGFFFGDAGDWGPGGGGPAKLRTGDLLAPLWIGEKRGGARGPGEGVGRKTGEREDFGSGGLFFFFSGFRGSSVGMFFREHHFTGGGGTHRGQTRLGGYRSPGGPGIFRGRRGEKGGGGGGHSSNGFFFWGGGGGGPPGTGPPARGRPQRKPGGRWWFYTNGPGQKRKGWRGSGGPGGGTH